MQLRSLCLGVLCAALVALPAAVSAQPGHNNGKGAKGDNHEQQRPHERQGDRRQRKDGGDQKGAQQAASQAQQRYGGRVLKVDRSGSGYDVRLLQDDGRVITVTVGD